MSKTQPSRAELIHHHLKYEFDMLCDTYRRIGRCDDKIVENALIESFCVHARTLFEFFDKDRGARRYARSGYTPFDGGDVHRRKKLKQKLSNLVSHLMDGRTAISSEKIGPDDRAEMHTLLSAEFEKFKGNLLPEFSPPAE